MPDIIEMTLGKYIAQKRKDENLSQRELAKDIKISHSTISRIEKDDGISPDNATLKALATRLDLDYNYLLALNKSIDDEPEIRIIQRAAKKMKEEDKKRMLDILKLTFDDLFKEDDDIE
ncbi:helix-turn-helix domain-containing protein [Clostridium sp. DL1XJH146]